MKIHNLNQITIEHINRLKDIELSQLLHALIRIEAEKNNLEDLDSSVPLNITTGDEGSDGRVQWKGKPQKTKWFKNRYIVFQNKATPLGPSKCEEEILKKKVKSKPRKLKLEIEKVVKANGCYILFTNESIVDKGKTQRIAAFRKAIKTAKHKNSDKFQIHIYDANSIKDWVNENISAVTLVQKFNGITKPAGFIDWTKWESISKANVNPYETDTTINNNKALIEKSIRTEKVVRITGHSGLGKTRLVLESFRSSDLKNSLVYCDMQGDDNITEIKNYILSHQDNQNGIIVLDNCSVKNHLILSPLIKAEGYLKLITIGLDDSASVEDSKIKLEKNKQREVVREIITKKLDKHTATDIEYISTISEGYPWMAIRFCDIVLKEGISELNKIPIDEFIKKLIFGLSPENEVEYDIIRGCSVFSAFGFLDDSFKDVINEDIKKVLKAQMKFIRTRIIDGSITETKFNQVCNKFLGEDIIEKRGKFYIVKPTILAINLAANWLLNTDSDKIIEIIQELKQVRLEEKFLERFKDLDQIDKAKDIVADLWGPKGPFGAAEVLNTTWGSLLFRYVVEVNPISTTQTLQSAFANLSKDGIYKIDEGRRNLVWAIEKLCFRKETFADAAKLLYSFAVSENEEIGNNSLSQFRQLFHVYLPGTEANLNERIEILKWGLNKNDDDYTKVAIQAMDSGLTYDHFHRMGGAERQGSGAPLKDYVPTLEEIRNYWQILVQKLTQLACSQNTHAELAKSAISDNIRAISSAGLIDLIVDALEKIMIARGTIWPSALSNLKMTLSFEKHLPEAHKDKIQGLVDKLSPKDTDIENLLALKVTKPQWEEFEKDKEGHYIDKQKLNAEAFAEKIIAENIDWAKHLPTLLAGEQMQGFNFGKRLAELIPNPEFILSLSITELRKIDPSVQSPEFIAGVLAGCKDKKLVDATIERFINDELIRQHSFYLVRVISPAFVQVNKLFELVDKFGLSIEMFRHFQYGRALDSLSIEEVLFLCEKISSYGKAGKWTALSLLFMFCHSNNESWNKSKDTFKKLISSENLITKSDLSIRVEGYHWSESATKILNSGNETQFAITLAKQIVESCDFSKHISSLDVYTKNLVRILFEKYFKDVWPVFGEGLIGDYIVFSRIEQMIGSHNGNLGGTLGLAFTNSDRYDIIFKWCSNHSIKAVERIAHMMPLSVNVDGKIKWHPFSKKILDKFGDNEGVISNLNSNIGTYGTVGSRVFYFELQKELFQELLNHPIERVKKWASKMLEYVEKDIKRERIDDEERYL